MSTDNTSTDLRRVKNLLKLMKEAGVEEFEVDGIKVKFPKAVSQWPYFTTNGDAVNVAPLTTTVTQTQLDADVEKLRIDHLKERLNTALEDAHPSRVEEEHLKDLYWSV